MDQEQQHVFVYNQIFFSFAIDSKETFKDVSSTDSNPSYTATNHDILGLRSLQVIDIDGLHIIATCHVNYKGYRVIAQSIIPGILTNTDQSSLTEYGSVDDGASIYTNEEFTEIMKNLCEHLSIKEAKILDGEEKEHQIFGSIDIKGIRGTDRRKYLLDLVRLTPRDTNYLGKNFTSCIVRPELVRIFQKTRDLEYATKKLTEEGEANEEIKEEKKDEKNYFDMNDEEKKQAIEKRNKENEQKKQKHIDRLKKFDKFMKEAPKFSYNLNVFTNAKMVTGDYKDDEKSVRELGNFINDSVIPKVIKMFELGDNVPTDSESLSDFLHSQGLNVRYLGKIAETIGKEKLPHIRALIERSIISRCATKIINEMMINCASTKLSKFLCHILNILLAPSQLIEKLNSDELIEEPKKEEVKQQKHKPQEQNEPSGKGKNKNKQNKNKKKNKVKNGEMNGTSTQDEKKLFEIKFLSNKNFKHMLDDNKNSKLLKLKPKDFYNKITLLAKKRYNYELDPELINLEFRKTYKNKISFLRELCTKLGLKIHSRDYQFQEQSTDDNANKKNDQPQILPFTEADIVEMIPTIKNVDIVNYDYKNFISNAKSAMKEGYYEQAFEFLNQAININLQIAGPINKEAATCLSNLAQIHFKFGDYNQALQLQTKCVVLSEKIFGKIHSQTAQAYANLAQITTITNYPNAFEYMSRALYIYEIVCGENHPEISAICLSLGFLYMEIDDSQSAVDCFKQALYRNISMYGEEHIQVANSYQIIANAYQNLELFRKALEYQEKSHEILSKIYKEDDTIIKNSLATIDQFTKLSVQKEMSKKVEQRSKPDRITL